MAIDKVVIKEGKLNKYLVEFEIILKKPESAKLPSEAYTNRFRKKRELFYARNVSDLEVKIISTYSCSGRVRNINVLDTMSI